MSTAGDDSPRAGTAAGARELPDGVIVVPAGEGRRLPRYSGGDLVLKLAAADAPAGMTIVETSRGPGESRGPALHRHGFVEVFYVLEGGYDFDVDGHPIHATAGALVLVPSWTAHGFASDGRQASRLLNICIPGSDLERFFEEAARLPADDGGSRGVLSSHLREVGLRHGIEFI